jgi:hypothetical protein
MDTNVLVHAHDPANPEKQKRACELVENLAVIHKLKNKAWRSILVTPSPRFGS